MVPKKADVSGKKNNQMVIDNCNLNRAMIADKYPSPYIDDILDQLAKAKLFATMYLASGFYQIPMDPTDIEKTAFTTPMDATNV